MDKKQLLEQINGYVRNTMIEYLEIKFTDSGDDYIEATMPVNKKTINPSQILHGGAMMALAETVGSALSYAIIDKSKYDVRGLEINGNHIKSTPIGSSVKAKATLIHKGRKTHVSEIKITDQNGKLLNTSRMTNMIIDLDK